MVGQRAVEPHPPRVGDRLSRQRGGVPRHHHAVEHRRRARLPRRDRRLRQHLRRNQPDITRDLDTASGACSQNASIMGSSAEKERLFFAKDGSVSTCICIRTSGHVQGGGVNGWNAAHLNPWHSRHLVG